MTASAHDTMVKPIAQRLSRRRILAVAAALGPVVAAWHLSRAAASAPVATPTPAGFSGLMKIGGNRRLWFETRGAGAPTVILEPGYRLDADIWDTVALAPDVNGPAVLPGVSSFTHTIAYDRPGTYLDPTDPNLRSRSDPVPMPRTAQDMVADLHTLLGVAGILPPYVMVGHSLGGLLVRLYASTYPTEVVGMVQIDPFHEDVWPAYEAVLTPEEWSALDTLNRTTPADLLAIYPQLELIDFDASTAQMRAAKAASPLRPMPLVVLEHGISLGAALEPGVLPPNFSWDKIDTETTAVYRALAESVPGGRLIVARKSGHNIMVDQPDLVIDEIRQVVEAVRNPGTWATPVASPVATSNGGD